MLFFNFVPICSKFIQKTFLLPPLQKFTSIAKSFLGQLGVRVFPSIWQNMSV